MHNLVLGILTLPRSVVALAAVLISAALAPVFAAPDIDVLYISQTPRYNKFITFEQGGVDQRDLGLSKVRMADGHENEQRWPAKGELVTFTAFIKNMGDSPTGEFTYKWYLDGKEVSSGKIKSVEPDGKVTSTWQWKWDSEWIDHDVKFVADPENKVSEIRKTNNSREDRTNAFSFRLHVVQSVYDWFKTEAVKINPNIAGVEDWMQAQMGYMNQMYKEAVYPSSPNGILQRMRLDEVVVEPEGWVDPDPRACHAPPNPEWDCRWGLTPDEYPKIFTDPGEPHPEFITGPYTWDLHEWSHQQGKIDVYNYFLGREGNHVQPYGHNVTQQDLMTSTVLLGYSEMHASVFNYEFTKRRGFFGEYQFDLPKTCKVRVLDAYGRPIPNAKIKFYQSTGHEINAPEDFVGTTDSKGIFTMPNRSVGGEEILPNGHAMRDNPWGLFHLAGFNGFFFCDIQVNGQTDYQYVESFPFNMAFRSGEKDSYTYDLRTTIVPDGRLTRNDLLGIKMVSAKKGYAVGAAGTILEWDGKTWSIAKPVTGQALYSVDADSTGALVCAVGGKGTILTRTSEGWEKKEIRDNPNLVTVAVVSPTVIVVGAERGEVFRSTDKGATWERIDVPSQWIKTIRFANENAGIIICEGPSAYYTIDGGLTWTKSESDFKYTRFDGWSKPKLVVTGELTDVCMASDKEAYACCEQGATFKSLDGGKTWAPLTEFANFGRWDPLYAIDFKPGGSGWCAGGVNKWYNTVSIRRFADRKWSNDAATTYGASDCIYDISCVNGDDGWLVGKGGLILHLQGVKFAPVKPFGAPK